MTIKTRKNSQVRYLFHPLEISFSGYSNSGKTTLISRMVEVLSLTYKIGYVKHDAHSFAMDKPGKDTDIVKRSGAEKVYINDADHYAFVGSGTFASSAQKQLFIDNDFVFVEGYKNSALPKIMVIDAEENILKQQKEQPFEQILCFVGQKEAKLQEDLGAPYFHRDDIEGIINFFLSWLENLSNKKPVFGLLLGGGRSSRMGSDKALLDYHGKPQIVHSFELLREHCENVYVSSRESQWPNLSSAHFNTIVDRFIDFGPLGGMLSAMLYHPEAAWLVVACDLPFLDGPTIENLISHRDPLKCATAYLSCHDGLPEPLCAVYEPKVVKKIWLALGEGQNCPRKILLNSACKFLDLTNPRALDNINHHEEYVKAKSFLSVGGFSESI